MAATVATVQNATVMQYLTITDVTLDNSYQEGGEPVTAAQLGLQKVEHAWCAIKNGSESEEYVSSAWYSASEGKLHLQNAKTGKEVAGTKDMSKVVVRVFAIGRARTK